MKIKFNKFERVAGLFVLTAIMGSVFASVAVAIKRGWLDAKVPFETTIKTADGVHIGTVVQMAGLRAGAVTSVDLKSNNEVRVRFEISEKFHARVREDSVIRVVRPFVIGEKVLDLSVGTDDKKMQLEGALVASEPTADIMDLVSGRTLGPYMESMGRMMDNLKFVADAFLDPERSRAIVKIFDELSPLLRNTNLLVRETSGVMLQINKKQQLVTSLNNLMAMGNELARILPEFTKNSPDLAHDLSKIAKNTALLTDELQKFMPMMTEMAPEFPGVSRRAIEALNETVVTLKALQKSFLLRGSVKDVRDEESKRDEQRQPASDKKQ